MDPTGVLRHALAHESDVRLAVLFGSEARGARTPRGDLDVGVLGPHAPGRLDALAVALSRATHETVDVIDLSAAPPLLRFEIARDGIVVHEAEPHLWSDFKARAFLDWWDWAPLARRFAGAAAARLRAGHGHGPA